MTSNHARLDRHLEEIVPDVFTREMQRSRSTTTRRAVRGAGLALAGAFALSGCLAGDGYPILEREPTDADRLPPVFIDEAFDEYDFDSARLSARYEGAALYVLRSLTGEVCLAVAHGEASGVACSGSGGVGLTVPQLPPFEMGPAPMVTEDGWTVLSENIRVADE